MRYGYAYKHRDDENHGAQITALKKAVCDEIFEDCSLEGRWRRPNFLVMLERANSNDTIIIWKLQNISKSISEIVMLMRKIVENDINIELLCDDEYKILNKSSFSETIHILSSFQDIVVAERLQSGAKKYEERGRFRGRKPKLTARQQEKVIEESKTRTASDIARDMNVHRSTITRVISRNQKLIF